jgi:predicted metalloendopeptidase
LLGGDLSVDVDPLNWGIYDSAHLLGLSVEPGLHAEGSYVAFLLQGGLGLPDRDHYVSSAPDRQALRTRYQRYIGRMLELAGFDHAVQRAEGVMALEAAIAQTHATREASSDERNADNLWTRADFVRQAPGLDWPAFFAAAGLSKQQSIVAWQPSAVKGVAALVASRPLSAWLDYLRFHLIHAYAEALPRAFAEEALAAHGSASGQRGSRAPRAMEATQQAMSGVLGRLYAERYFPAGQKARVQAITANVIEAFRQRVEAVTWLSPATKRQALAKLKTLYFGVGYPERWQDYSGLAVSAVDAVGNLQRLADWNYRLALARLGRPVDVTEWWIAPQTAGAVLLFQQNAYNFSAALLQPPKFDPPASDAANYGAIGAIIGHEIGHGFDDQGADYDAAGRKFIVDGRGYGGLRDRHRAAGKSVLQLPSLPRPHDQRQVDAGREPRRPRRPCRRLRRVSSYARQQGQRQGICATAGPGVLHRLRTQLAQQDTRRRAARPDHHERSRPGESSDCNCSQYRCMV